MSSQDNMESQQTPKEGTSATNSAVVSGYKGKYIVEPYSSIDADIILVASDTVDRWEDEHIVNCCQAFKVHKEKLRRASTVFKDMLDCGVDEQEGASELPHVHLTETSAVIRALLGGVYANERDKIVPLESLDWHVCKQVWEAARKYELHMLAAYAGDILVAKLPELDPDEAIELYHRATLFGFRELADKCQKSLCKIPIYNMSEDTISGMATDLLIGISYAREERLLKAVGKAHQILLGARYSSDQTEQTVKELEELFPELKGMKVTTTGKQAYSAEDWGDGGSWGNQNTGGWGNKSHMVGWDNSSRTL